MKRIIFVVAVIALIAGGYYFVANNGPARVTAAWNSLTMKTQPTSVATLPSVPTTSQDEAVGKALAPYIAQMMKGTNDNTVAIGKLVGVANTHQQQLDAHGAAIMELQSGLQAVAIRVTPTTEEGIRKVIEDELRGKGLYSTPPVPVQPPAATGDASPPIPAPEEEVGVANPLDNDPAAMGPPPVYGDPSVLLADMSGGYRPPAHVGKPRCPSGFQFTDRGICERFNARTLTPEQKATLASCDRIETKVVKLADGKDHLLQRCAN